MMAPIPATEPLTAAPTYVLISWVVVLAWLLIDLVDRVAMVLVVYGVEVVFTVETIDVVLCGVEVTST